MDQDISQKEFKSMAELTAYLSQLENRITELERQNETMQSSTRMFTEMNERIYKIVRGLPKTKIYSNNFFVRALAIWGHNIVIDLLLLIFLAALLAIIYFTFFAAAFPPILENLP